MADGEIKTEISRNESENTASNVVFIQIADNGGNVATITGGALDVNATVTLETAFVDNSIEFTLDTSKVNAQGFIVEETAVPTVTEGRIGLARMTPERVMLQVIVDDADDTRRLTINADGSINTNPAIVSSGTEVNDFDTAASVAKGATSNHDYTVVNTTFLCKRVDFSGSGRMKVEVQSGPLASLVTKAVRFTQRDTGGSVIFDPALPVPVTSTGTLRVIRTQRSIGSLDIFSTIQGEDI